MVSILAVHLSFYVYTGTEKFSFSRYCARVLCAIGLLVGSTI